MEHHLFVFLLFIGFLAPVLPAARKHYYLIKQEKTWSDAQAYCRSTYTDLATIDSSDDMTRIQNEAYLQHLSSSVWIGLYTNVNNWYWSINNEPLNGFTSWGIIDPNNLIGDEWCVFINWKVWLDAPCDWTLYFVCFDGNKTGPDSYILITELKTWYEAQSYCRQHYTDLASARNSTENSIVGEKLLGGLIWFGLYREPWRWSDQTSNMSVIKWWGGNALDYSMNKSCGSLYGILADHTACSDLMPFFCYIYPEQKQIVKVKVKSSQDVNDPIITATILEKIEQKLMDQGIAENITMTWRVQPDGKVFYKEKKNVTKVVNNTTDKSCL